MTSGAVDEERRTGDVHHPVLDGARHHRIGIESARQRRPQEESASGIRPRQLISELAP
jgi:hypothetical protein